MNGIFCYGIGDNLGLKHKMPLTTLLRYIQYFLQVNIIKEYRIFKSSL